MATSVIIGVKKALGGMLAACHQREGTIDTDKRQYCIARQISIAKWSACINLVFSLLIYSDLSDSSE